MEVVNRGRRMSEIESLNKKSCETATEAKKLVDEVREAERKRNYPTTYSVAVDTYMPNSFSNSTDVRMYIRAV